MFYAASPHRCPWENLRPDPAHAASTAPQPSHSRWMKTISRPAYNPPEAPPWSPPWRRRRLQVVSGQPLLPPPVPRTKSGLTKLGLTKPRLSRVSGAADTRRRKSRPRRTPSTRIAFSRQPTPGLKLSRQQRLRPARTALKPLLRFAVFSLVVQL